MATVLCYLVLHGVVLVDLDLSAGPLNTCLTLLRDMSLMEPITRYTYRPHHTPCLL